MRRNKHQKHGVFYRELFLDPTGLEWDGASACSNAFPGRHTADEIELWIRQVSKFQIQHRLCGIGFWYSLRRESLHYVNVLVVSEPPTEDRVYSLFLYSCDVLFSIYIKVAFTSKYEKTPLKNVNLSSDPYVLESRSRHI